MTTYRLHRWSVTQYSDDPYLAPEQQCASLLGTRDTDGRFVKTSPVVKVEGKQITTRSGSVYILEDMDPDFRLWLEEEGIEYDPENPITFKKKKS
jgi:hypothetical protein